jgi:membrane protease YdiL (CAAX protease family)
MDLRTVSSSDDAAPGERPWGPRTVGIGIVAFVGVFVASPFLLSGIAVASGATDRADLSPAALLTATLVLQLGTLGIAYYFGPFQHDVSWAALGFRQLSRGRLAAWAAAALFGSILAGLVSVVVTEAVAPSLARPNLAVDLGLGSDASVAALLYAWITIALVVPLAEETFHRGFIFAGLAARWGVWPAILASAAVFSVAHLTPWLILPAFASGIIFAWVYWRSGSIWPIITAHLAQNSLALAGAVLT